MKKLRSPVYLCFFAGAMCLAFGVMLMWLRNTRSLGKVLAIVGVGLYALPAAAAVIVISYEWVLDCRRDDDPHERNRR
jgi:vacuolar-type H+-ATPase subunit I/STV1